MSLELTTTVPLLSKFVGGIRAEFLRLSPRVVVLGPSEEPSKPAPPCVAWVPTEEVWSSPRTQGQAGSPGALFTREVPVTFMVFGGVTENPTWPPEEASLHDCDETEILVSRLVNAIHRLVSQNSYKWQSQKWFNSGRTGMGMACEVTFAFLLPLLREDNPTVTVTEFRQHTEIAT